jgi:hypothetical protein
MTYSFKTAGWPERLWRTNNDADIARGNVPGSTPFSTFGGFVSTGAVIGPNLQVGSLTRIGL